MLQSENQLLEHQGVLFLDACQGLSYQLAGALQRLGRKMSSFHSIESTPYVPMLCESWPGEWNQSETERIGRMLWSMNFILVCDDSSLGLNIAPSQAWIQSSKARLQKLLELKSSLHLLFVFSQSTPQNVIDEFVQLSPNFTLFVTPALFGFRDKGLFDSSLESITRWKKSSEQALLNMTYMGDLVSCLVASLGPKSFLHKKIKIHNQQFTLQDWCKSFQEHFPVENKNILSQFFQKNKIEDTALKIVSSSSIHLENFESDLDLFPYNPTPFDRAIKTCARHFQLNPKMELIFPPSRSL